MDGMAGRPLKELNNQTTLQAAKTPNMDKMAERGITGLMDSIAPGIIPGSDTAHLSILGYNPYEVYTGRGPFEAVGVGVDVIPGDIAFRCNFSTSDEDGIITDRRAGRIRDGTDEIIATLNTMKLEGYEDIEIIFKESTGHRAVLVLRGEGLSGKVSDADPKVEGNKPKEVKALDDVSLIFPEKGMVFLLGKSGSGKTTLLRCINALETADGGEIFVDGDEIFDAAEHFSKNKKTKNIQVVQDLVVK